MYRNKFQKDFDFTSRVIKIMFGVVTTFIAIIWIAVIAFWIFAGTIAVKAADQIEQRGLKDVIEQIWFGPNNK
jgi:hypothetical protein